MCAKRLAEELNEGFIEDYSTPSKKPSIFVSLHILLLAMNSYVLSSVVPKAFKNRNPGLKSLHKFIYARVRIKTFD